MKRLKLMVKPKRLNLSSTTSEEPAVNDIDVLLKAHHSNTKEKHNLPWHKWIEFEKYLPLDNDDNILVWNPKVHGLYDTKSFVALQHYLMSKYNNWPNEATHWMRISIPEE